MSTTKTQSATAPTVNHLSATRTTDAVLDIAWAAVIALVTSALHWRILSLGWTYDDPFHLHFLLTHRFRMVVTPTFWRELPFKMYTPLQFASYKVDLHFFGVNARLWYVHQLISLSAAAAALFALLRLWWRRSFATIGTALFVCNPQVLGWAGLLMARQYIEGFVFACVAITLYGRYLRQKRLPLLVIAVSTYAIACLCKEVFVPLPILLFLMPESTSRESARSVLPFLAVTALYLALREAMLGTFFGGYGWAVPADERVRFYARAPFRILFAAFAPLKLWLAVAAGTCVFCVRRPLRIVGLAIAACVLILPILPVSTELEPRYLVLPSLFGLLACVAAAESFTRLRGIVPALSLLAWVIAAGVVNGSLLLKSLVRQSGESRFFLQLGPADVLAHPIIPPGAMPELLWLRSYFGRPAGTAWYYDEIYRCSHDLAGRRIWSRWGSKFILMPSGVASDSPCDDDRHALTVQMNYSADTLYWTVGPYHDGTYTLLIGEGIQAFDIPAHWGFHLPGMTSLTFRIRYEARSRWRTYSPPLTIDGTRGTLSWQRPERPAAHAFNSPTPAPLHFERRPTRFGTKRDRHPSSYGASQGTGMPKDTKTNK